MKSRLLAGSCLLALLVGPLVGEEPAKPQEVPYRLADTKHLVVRVKINGQGPFNFIIDTGAPALFIATKTAAKAGLKADNSGWATIDKLDLEGGVRLPKARAGVQDLFQLEGMNGMGAAGMELHGVIGFTVLARFKIEYDLTTDRMLWTRLKHEPAEPRIKGKAAGPGGLETMGSVVKMMGSIMGRNAELKTYTRGFWGVELADADGGVSIQAVLPKGPAERAGLKVGDRLTGIDGRKVASAHEALERASRIRAGSAVKLSIQRGDKSEDLTLTTENGL